HTTHSFRPGMSFSASRRRAAAADSRGLRLASEASLAPEKDNIIRVPSSLRLCGFEACRIEEHAADPHGLHRVICFHGLQRRATKQDEVGSFARLHGSYLPVQGEGLRIVERGSLQDLSQAHTRTDQTLHL